MCSLGGTTATMLGHLASPRPLAVLNVYGMVDFVLRRPPAITDAIIPFSPASGLFTEAQVAAELANRDPSNTLGEVWMIGSITIRPIPDMHGTAIALNRSMARGRSYAGMLTII